MLVVEYHHGGEASVTPDTLSKTLWYGLDVSDFPKVLCYIPLGGSKVTRTKPLWIKCMPLSEKSKRTSLSLLPCDAQWESSIYKLDLGFPSLQSGK